MKLPFYSKREEQLNFITHAFGAIISIIGLVFLIYWGLEHKDNWLLLGLVVFGITLIAAFGASTFYHGVSKVDIKKKLRLIDHSAIYLLIAGTYTPFTLGNLRNDWGILLLAIVWTAAISGIVFKYLIRHRMDRMTKLDTGLYVVIGFLVVFFMRPAIDNIELWGIFFLALGGAFYLAGVVFYLWKQLPYNHAIWHLFVLAGAGTHYFSVLYFAAPPQV